MSWYREQLESYLSQLEIKANAVFDIGGKDKPIKGRTKTWEVHKYSIWDLPEFNLEQTYDLLPKADTIFCLEVFEYLLDDLTAIKNISTMLDKQGIAYLTFPLIYPVHQDVDYDSRRYTETGVKRLLRYAGLKGKIIYRTDRSGRLTHFYAADGMRAAKEVDHTVTGYIVEATHVENA